MKYLRQNVCHEHLLKEKVRNLRRDGGRPSNAARQGEALNDLKLRGLRAQVVSVEEKGVQRNVTYGPARRTQVNHCRRIESKSDDIKTGSCSVAWDQFSGNLCLGWAVSGVEMA